MNSLSNKIQDVFNEPGCGKNQGKSETERKKGCTKPLQPGGRPAAAPSTAPRSRSSPSPMSLISCMGPIACEGNSWDNRSAASSGSDLWRRSFTTDMNETDIVFGGEKRLYKAIREVIEKYDPPAIFVYQTCVPAMIGDDIDAVCRTAADKFGKP